MDVACDGHSVYGKPFEPRFENDQYLRSFLSVYQALHVRIRSKIATLIMKITKEVTAFGDMI